MSSSDTVSSGVGGLLRLNSGDLSNDDSDNILIEHVFRHPVLKYLLWLQLILETVHKEMKISLYYIMM